MVISFHVGKVRKDRIRDVTNELSEPHTIRKDLLSEQKNL